MNIDWSATAEVKIIFKNLSGLNDYYPGKKNTFQVVF